jgi:ubiquitin carboxyl-terminal hydrolase 4/11/15
MGATSRANSVRFDESANQGHWSHNPHRGSIDLIPRTGSSMSAHPMLERTYSHKSDGRQSSTGHSVHSATSGRANSMGLDTPFVGLGASVSPLEPPGFAPGLSILGTVPSIIRCWLDTNFKHDSLLYAAICTGSYASFVDKRLVERLGINDQVREDNGRRIKLAVFLPEAVTRMSSSREGSPAPQLPTITVDFAVITGSTDEEDKAIQIFIGSDVLRTHNADILFSSNTMTLYDDDRCKLSIPLVRPEDERTFRSLYVTSKAVSPIESFGKANDQGEEQPLLNGLKQTVSLGSSIASAAATPLREPVAGRDPSPAADLDEKPSRSSFGDDISTTSTRRSFESRPPLGTLTTANESKPPSDTNPATAPARSGPSPMIWSNWRRDNESKASTQTDSWAKAGQTYQRREQGIKVLRPLKPASRTFSATSTSANAPSPVTNQSRFFDEGRKRPSMDALDDTKSDEREKSKEGVPASSSKTRSANPVGGASAFSWLGK